MNILILHPNRMFSYNWGHALFRQEIGRQHNVIYYGQGYPKYTPKLPIKKVLDRLYNKKPKPDFILTNGWRYSLSFKGLGEITDIPKVHINVDYVREPGITKQNIFFAENKYDLVFAITQRALNLHIKNKVCDKIRLLPFSVDTNIYKNLNLKKRIEFLQHTQNVQIFIPIEKLLKRYLKVQE